MFVFFQIRAVRSALPVSKNIASWSWLKETLLTALVWPSKRPLKLPVAAFHLRTAPSVLAVATVRPVGLNATSTMSCV